MFLNPIQIEQRHKAELKQNQQNEEFKWSRRLLCLIYSWHSWFTKNAIHTDAGVIWTKFEVTSFLKIFQDFFQMNHLFVVFQKWPVPPDHRTDPMLGGRILSDLFVPHFSKHVFLFSSVHTSFSLGVFLSPEDTCISPWLCITLSALHSLNYQFLHQSSQMNDLIF